MIKMPDFILSFVTIGTTGHSTGRLPSAPDSAILKRVRLMNLNFSGKDFRKLLFILCLYLFYPLGMIAAGLWPQCVFSFFLYFSVKGILQHHARGTHMRWIYKKKFLFPLLFLVNPLLMQALGTPALWLFFPLLAGLSWAALKIRAGGFSWIVKAISFAVFCMIYLFLIADTLRTRNSIMAFCLLGMAGGVYLYTNPKCNSITVGDFVLLVREKMPLKEWWNKHLTFTRFIVFLFILQVFVVPQEFGDAFGRFCLWMCLPWSINGIRQNIKEYRHTGLISLKLPIFYAMLWTTLGELIFPYNDMLGVLVMFVPPILTAIYICYCDYKYMKPFEDYMNGYTLRKEFSPDAIAALYAARRAKQKYSNQTASSSDSSSHSSSPIS